MALDNTPRDSQRHILTMAIIVRKKKTKATPDDGITVRLERDSIGAQRERRRIDKVGRDEEQQLLTEQQLMGGNNNNNDWKRDRHPRNN